MFSSHREMKCLPGQPAGTSTTQYGSFWFCSQNPSCNFFCSEDEGYLFEKAINTCNSTQQSCPECDEHCKLAKMRIMKNVMNANYGRPIFVCSFWVWGDVKIPSRSEPHIFTSGGVLPLAGGRGTLYDKGGKC